MTRISEDGLEDGGGVVVVVRQECGEDGAAGVRVSCALDPDAAAMARDDALRYPKAEAIADVLLGGEEGVEDFGYGFLRDARACVDDADGGSRALAIAPGLRSSDSYGEAAMLRHGVDGVGDLVGEDLPQFAFEAPDLEFAAVLFFDGEVLRLKLSAEEAEEFVEND